MGRPAKMTDSDLLDATYEMLWEHGCDDVTIRDLETALDLRAPSIYRRFGSRDELLACAVDRYVQRVVLGRISRLLDGAVDPVEGIREFFLSVVEVPSGAVSARGCLLTMTSQQSAGAVPVIAAAVARGFDLIEAALCRSLDRAVAQGHPFASPTADLARTLLQSFQGVLVLARYGFDQLDVSVEITIDALLLSHRLAPDLTQGASST
ncbi:MAG: TetR/AcrR family transcriptional regulator [Actinobacteria bacterium]|nr:TetR/AcrR family transcriptional regulator [Actinomycetota bacterium]